MSITVWYLEPVSHLDEQTVRRELAKLREGNTTQWAIAEVLGRMYAVCELVLCVSVGAWSDEAQTSDLSGADGDRAGEALNAALEQVERDQGAK